MKYRYFFEPFLKQIRRSYEHIVPFIIAEVVVNRPSGRSHDSIERHKHRAGPIHLLSSMWVVLFWVLMVSLIIHFLRSNVLWWATFESSVLTCYYQSCYHPIYSIECERRVHAPKNNMFDWAWHAVCRFLSF